MPSRLALDARARIFALACSGGASSGPNSARLLTRPGSAAARCVATMVPIEWPTTCAFSPLAAAMARCAASTNLLVERAPSTRLERPEPGRSKRTRLLREKAGSKGVKVLVVPPRPGLMTTGSPSPSISTAKRSTKSMPPPGQRQNDTQRQNETHVSNCCARLAASEKKRQTFLRAARPGPRPPRPCLSAPARRGSSSCAARKNSLGGGSGSKRRGFPRHCLSLLPFPLQAGERGHRGSAGADPARGAAGGRRQGATAPAARPHLLALPRFRAAHARRAAARARAPVARGRRAAGGGTVPPRPAHRDPGYDHFAAEEETEFEKLSTPAAGPRSGLRHRAHGDPQGHLRRERPRNRGGGALDDGRAGGRRLAQQVMKPTCPSPGQTAFADA